MTRDPSPRERDVLELLNQGLRVGEVAARLGIARGTVTKHKANLIEKGINVRRRVKKEATVAAMLAAVAAVAAAAVALAEVDRVGR